MANLPETPQWEDGIYQIEVSDPVLGGPDGISNRQAKQLAKRTSYLKQQVEKGGSDLAAHIAAADPHTQYATKASPTFTGTPTAPTPTNSDNSKKLATTEFVARALTAGIGSDSDLMKEIGKKLAKDQNGADIPDPALFVKNLGLGALQASFTDKSGKIALNGGWGLGVRNEQIAGTMAALDVSRFDYFAPKDNIGPIPGQWVGGITHAMGDQIGWQIAGLGQGSVGGSPRAFMRMKQSNGNFSDWGELYHTLNKPTAADVGALPVNGKADSARAADTAAKLTTARKIAGVAFDGTADISLGPDNVGAVSAGGGDYNKNFRLGSVATLGNESNPVQLISAASGQAADNFVAWTSYTWYQDYVRTGVVRAGNTAIKSFAVEINGVRFLEIGRDGTLLNGNMASDLRLGQQESMNVNIPGSGQSSDSVVPSGCYVTGLTSTSTGSYIGTTKIFYRRLQRKVAGNWVDATWL
ncbi:phage tail fiber protein [Salmonella enterica subsp. enterica serovar Gaminara str. ATCC BAA-711]|nr:phage tail fiber protein [Salmonella enterica subsp. enterica serovar Gaminara str. ATCC BAA-711]